MKKQIIKLSTASVLSLALSYSADAQVTTASSTNAYLATAYVGSSTTSTLKDIIFKTNAVERMRMVGTTGNLGIGLTAPLGKLDIKGGGTSYLNSFNIVDNASVAKTSMFHSGGSFYLGTATAASLADASADFTQRMRVYEPTSILTNPIIVLGDNINQSLTMLHNGNVGIGTVGTTLVSSKLDVHEKTATNIVVKIRRGLQADGVTEDPTMPTTYGKPYLQIGGSEFRNNVQTLQTIGLGVTFSGGFQPAEIGFLNVNTAGNQSGDIVFANRNSTNNVAPTEVMRITSTGNLLLGTPNDNVAYKFSCLGAIRCTKVVVEIGWADYVFAKNYKLMPLNDVESFIATNKHLPNIPSAKEIEEKGLDIGAVQSKQMEKIEELTLYIIELNKRISELEKTRK